MFTWLYSLHMYCPTHRILVSIHVHVVNRRQRSLECGCIFFLVNTVMFPLVWIISVSKTTYGALSCPLSTINSTRYLRHGVCCVNCDLNLDISWVVISYDYWCLMIPVTFSDTHLLQHNAILDLFKPVQET